VKKFRSETTRKIDNVSQFRQRNRMSKILWRPACIVFISLSCISSAWAELLSANDPQFGANSLTIDTTSGLAWLDLPFSKDLSYQQMGLAIQPGGAFKGFRYATVPEVQALFAHAGIANGFQLESSLGAQNIGSLISLLGATSQQDGRLESFGISGTFSGGGLVVMGLDFVFSSGAPGFQILGPPGLGPAYAETTSFPTVGNWLVKVVPEPNALALTLVGLVLVQFGRGRHSSK